MLKILLVDHTELSLAPAKASLENGNLEVVATTSDEEALRLADTLQPDLIVLFELPSASVESLTRRFKDNPKTAHTKLLRLGVQQEAVMDNVARMLGISPRRHVRIECKFTVGIAEGGTVYQGMAENVSEGGLFLTTKNQFATETLLRLHFSLPRVERRKIQALGKVVRIEEAAPEQYGYGIEFVDIDVPARLGLMRLLEKA